MSDLSFTIGKEVGTNKLIHGELIPNLLILGGAASGKTTLTNHIIDELSSSNSPDELQLILVSTNNVVFSPFHTLPHLIQPVTTDAKAFPDLLDSLKKEVDKRHKLLADAKCKSAQKFNQKHPNKMPPIVLIIDEIADIMMANNDMETQLVRFFQAYQRVSDVHIIMNVATSENYKEKLTPLMISCLGMNKILLYPSHDDSYNIFPELENKLDFGNLNERLGYYFNEYSDNKIRKFSFQGIKP